MGASAPVEITIRREGVKYIVDPNGVTIPPSTAVRWTAEGSDVVLWFPRQEIFGLSEQPIAAGESVTLSFEGGNSGETVAYSVYIMTEIGFAGGGDGNEPNIIIG